MPQRLEDALALANQCECKQQASVLKKIKKQQHDDSIEKLNDIELNDIEKLRKSLTAATSSMERKILDKFNMLSGRLGMAKTSLESRDPPDGHFTAMSQDRTYRDRYDSS